MSKSYRISIFYMTLVKFQLPSLKHSKPVSIIFFVLKGPVQCLCTEGFSIFKYEGLKNHFICSPCRKNASLADYFQCTVVKCYAIKHIIQVLHLGPSLYVSLNYLRALMVVRPSTVSEKWESKGSWVLSSNCCRSLTHDRGRREKYQQIYQRLG